VYDSKLIEQIGNYGSLLHWEPNRTPVGPSTVTDAISGIQPHALTTLEIEELVTYFVDAEVRAKKANFDGVQVHAAHGFLLNKFINPYYNSRKDQYGGNTENRARIILEILEGIKQSCGEDFLILFKINSDDYVDEAYGFRFEESRKVCSYLSDKGFDAIEISSGLAGGSVTPARGIDEIAYNLEHAKVISSEINTPIILVGGIRSIDVSERILNETTIHGIGMTRAWTYEPDFINRWQDGAFKASNCVGCNKCFTTDGQMCIFNLKNTK